MISNKTSVPHAPQAQPDLLAELFAANVAGEEALIDQAFMELKDLNAQRGFDLNRSIACSLAASGDGSAWLMMGIKGTLDFTAAKAGTSFESEGLVTQVTRVLDEVGLNSIVGNAFLCSQFSELMMDTEWSAIARSLANGCDMEERPEIRLAQAARTEVILPVMVELPKGELWTAELADAFEPLIKFATTVRVGPDFSHTVTFRVESVNLPRELAASQERSRLSASLVPALLQQGFDATSLRAMSAWILASEAETEGNVSVLLRQGFSSKGRFDLPYLATPRMLLNTQRVLGLIGIKDCELVTVGTTEAPQISVADLVRDSGGLVSLVTH